MNELTDLKRKKIQEIHEKKRSLLKRHHTINYSNPLDLSSDDSSTSSVDKKKKKCHDTVNKKRSLFTTQDEIDFSYSPLDLSSDNASSVNKKKKKCHDTVNKKRSLFTTQDEIDFSNTSFDLESDNSMNTVIETNEAKSISEPSPIWVTRIRKDEVTNTENGTVIYKSSDTKRIPSHYECCEKLKLNIPLINIENHLYYHNGKCYESIMSNDLIRLYRENIDYNVFGTKDIKRQREWYDFLLTDPAILHPFPNDEYSHFAVLNNGVYDIMNKQLLDHSLDRIVFTSIDADYVKEGETEIFDAFLENITNGNKTLIQRIWYMLAYTFMQSTEAKVFFVMGTAPNSGKSLLGHFIENLFMKKFTSPVALTDFNKPFSLAPLVGSAVNISLDLPSTKLNAYAISLLKTITGNDVFTIKQKYVPDFSYKNRSTMIFATNHPIRISENDDAFWDRLVYIPFDYSVPKSKQDPDLLRKLLTEKNAVVSKALRYGKKLIENHYIFPTTPEIIRTVNSWKGQHENSVVNFISKQCAINESYKGELTNTLYTSYCSFCNETAEEPVEYNKFKSILANKYHLKHCKIRLATNNPQSAFKGIQLSANTDDYFGGDFNEWD